MRIQNLLTRWTTKSTYTVTHQKKKAEGKNNEKKKIQCELEIGTGKEIEKKRRKLVGKKKNKRYDNDEMNKEVERKSKYSFNINLPCN